MKNIDKSGIVNAKTDSRLLFIVSICLIAAILFPYGQIVNHDFVSYDDPKYVMENPHVKAGLTRESIIWAFTTQHDGNWFPLTWLSHMLDCELYGLNPMGHHWTNLLIHMANTVLLFLIFQMMTGSTWRSGFVAALFALHPLHVESVAWVAERKDVLSTFFGMLTLLAYNRYVRQTHLINYLLIILFFGLGLMAKPMLVTWPFVLLLLDFWPLKRFHFKEDKLQSNGNSRFGWQQLFILFLEKIPLFILSAVSSVVTFTVQRSGGGVKSMEFLSLKARVSNTFASYVKYIVKTVWPHSFAVFYPHPGDTLPLWQIYGSILLIAIVTVFAMYALKQYPYMAVGWFWYLGTLLPVIGLVQVGGQAMADRYTYIPLTGIFIIIA